MLVNREEVRASWDMAHILRNAGYLGWFGKKRTRKRWQKGRTSTSCLSLSKLGFKILVH